MDVLAHAPSEPQGIDKAFLQTIVDRHMSMMPTLKMFATTASRDPGFLHPIYDVVRQFPALGGDLMFGTDVGYMTDYSTGDEFSALVESGLNARDLLLPFESLPGIDLQRARAIITGRPEMDRERTQAWLDRHIWRVPLEACVILDDDSDMAHLSARLVKTTMETGLTQAHVDRAVVLLGGPEPRREPCQAQP